MPRTRDVQKFNELMDAAFALDAEHPFLGDAIEPSPEPRKASAMVRDLERLASVLKYSDAQPRDDHGRWSDGGGGGDAGASPREGARRGRGAGGKDVWLQTPGDAIECIAKGEQATVAKEDLRATLDRAATRDDHPDMTHLTVDGTPVYAGGLGFSREQMPQIPDDHRERYMEAVERAGIKIRSEHVSPASLLPTQNQIDATKVGQMLKKADAGTMDAGAIFVSKDNYVLDGHHRWAMNTVQQFDGNADLKMPVMRIMADHKKALDTMYDYDKKHGIAGKPHGKLARIWYGKDWTE